MKTIGDTGINGAFLLLTSLTLLCQSVLSQDCDCNDQDVIVLAELESRTILSPLNSCSDLSCVWRITATAVGDQGSIVVARFDEIRLRFNFVVSLFDGSNVDGTLLKTCMGSFCAETRSSGSDLTISLRTSAASDPLLGQRAFIVRLKAEAAFVGGGSHNGQTSSAFPDPESGGSWAGLIITLVTVSVCIIVVTALVLLIILRNRQIERRRGNESGASVQYANAMAFSACEPPPPYEETTAEPENSLSTLTLPQRTDNNVSGSSGDGERIFGGRPSRGILSGLENCTPKL